MAKSGTDTRLESDICIHIFTVSAGIVGVCLTVIGLIRVVITLRKTDTVADNLLAIDAFLFLLACLSSYLALRHSQPASDAHRGAFRRRHFHSRLAPCGDGLRFRYLCHRLYLLKGRIAGR